MICLKKSFLGNFLFNNLVIILNTLLKLVHTISKTKPNPFLYFNWSLNFAASKILVPLKFCFPRPGPHGSKRKPITVDTTNIIKLF